MHYFIIIIVAHTTFHSLLNHLTNDFPEANIFFCFISIDSIIGLLLLLLFFNAFFLRKSASCTNINNTVRIDVWSYNCEYTNYMMFELEQQQKNVYQKLQSFKNALGGFKRGCARASAFYRRTIDYLTDFSPSTAHTHWIVEVFIWHFLFCHRPKCDSERFWAHVKSVPKRRRRKVGRKRVRNTSTISWSNINSCNVVSNNIIAACNRRRMHWLNIFSSIQYLDFPYLFVHYLRDNRFHFIFVALATQWLRTQNTRIFFCHALILDLHTYT